MCSPRLTDPCTEQSLDYPVLQFFFFFFFLSILFVNDVQTLFEHFCSI